MLYSAFGRIITIYVYHYKQVLYSRIIHFIPDVVIFQQCSYYYSNVLQMQHSKQVLCVVKLMESWSLTVHYLPVYYYYSIVLLVGCFATATLYAGAEGC